MKKFLWFLPLNFGVNLLVAINCTTAICSFIVNLPLLDVLIPLPWLLCLLCNIYSMIIWCNAYYGSYQESVTFIKWALNMLIIYTIFWIIFMILGMINHTESYVCVCKRCPESLWLFANNWHNTCKTSMKKSFNRDRLHFELYRGVTEYNDTLQPAARIAFSYNHNFDYVVLWSVIILTNFILGIITLASYLEELKCYEACKQIDLGSTSLASVNVCNNRPKIKVLKSELICPDNTDEIRNEM